MTEGRKNGPSNFELDNILSNISKISTDMIVKRKELENVVKSKK